ncbi:unnamed protein product [Lasius platythorax]|uniref:Uncharacterized protein n=1 Tax=Lasius platythorax TaxID=488582 RepID=A0AAV2P0Z6_9HYME
MTDATRAAQVFCYSNGSTAVISNYRHERHGEQSRSWQLDLHCKVSRLSRPTCAISLNCAVAAASSSERVKLVTKAPSLLPTLIFHRLPRSDKGSCIPLPEGPCPDSEERAREFWLRYSGET